MSRYAGTDTLNRPDVTRLAAIVLPLISVPTFRARGGMTRSPQAPRVTAQRRWHCQAEAQNRSYRDWHTTTTGSEAAAQTGLVFSWGLAMAQRHAQRDGTTQ